MLTLLVTKQESFDEGASQFIVTGPEQPLEVCFEHSLVSVSKWEAKHERAFLSNREKTTDEVLDYIRMMILTPDVPLDIVNALSASQMDELSKYIASPQSATKLRAETDGAPSKDVITAELIYYWMVAMRIPWEAQHWHINRLLTLIRVVSVKTAAANGQKQKFNPRDLAARNRALNAQRLQQHGTSG